MRRRLWAAVRRGLAWIDRRDDGTIGVYIPGVLIAETTIDRRQRLDA